MNLKTIDQAQLEGKTVLVKVDYNVPLKKNDQGQMVITDDTRIKITLPTIEYLKNKKCKIILMSHVGRPDGTIEEDFRMNPMATRLGELLHTPVAKVDQVFGETVKEAVQKMVAGDVLMLENNRFEPGETKNDEDLARKLASLADVYINDGFSLSHRAHASVEAITRFLPSYAGFTLAKEVEMLSKLTENPKKPLVVIVGGAKISDKVDAIKNLTSIADIILVGGGVANNFLKAEGLEVYNSYLQDAAVDEDKKEVDYVEFAKNLIDANSTDRMLLDDYIPLPKIVYPTDVYAAKDKNDTTGKHIVHLTDDGHETNSDVMYLDIGPKTQKLYQEIILQAETIFWNGPMGVFEEEAFAEGTTTIAHAIAKSKAITIVGGGDTIHAVDLSGTTDRYDYVSASGGASLEFLGGKTLPGIKPLIA